MAEKIVAIVAGAAPLYFGQEIFAPLALALLFVAVFRPLVRWLASVRIPPPVSATLITITCLGLIVVGDLCHVGHGSEIRSSQDEPCPKKMMT